MNNIPLCFTDTETTGLDRTTRRAWDFAMIRREPDGTEQTVSFFISDIDLSQADPAALAKGRFYERYRLPQEDRSASPQKYLNPFEAARQVARMTRGAQLVGCVPSFDEHHLIRLLSEHGYLHAWHYRPRCVETLALGWLAGKGTDLPPLDGRSDDLFALVGIDTSKYDRHTALGDATLARDVWDAVTRRAPLAGAQ